MNAAQLVAEHRDGLREHQEVTASLVTVRVMGKHAYSGSIGLVFAEIDVHSERPGYDEGHDVIGLVPSFAIVHSRTARLRLALGMHGNVASSFDFSAQPPLFPSPFVSETSIISLLLAAAYEVNERLWVGAELVPLPGYQRSIDHPRPVSCGRAHRDGGGEGGEVSRPEVTFGALWSGGSATTIAGSALIAATSASR